MARAPGNVRETVALPGNPEGGRDCDHPKEIKTGATGVLIYIYTRTRSIWT